MPAKSEIEKEDKTGSNKVDPGYRDSGKNKFGFYLIGVIILFMVLMIGLAVGSRYYRNLSFRSSRNYPQMREFMGQKGMMGRRLPYQYGQMNNQLNGQITNISGNKMTVTFPNGDIQTVTLSDTTTYSKLDQASQNDLTVGENVVITGQRTTDGLIDAKSVRITVLQITPSPQPTQTLSQ